MKDFVLLLLKALGAGIFDFIGDQLKGFKRDRALKKLGYLEAKEKADGKRIKILKKIEGKRARIRSDSRYARRMRRKYTRRN